MIQLIMGLRDRYGTHHTVCDLRVDLQNMFMSSLLKYVTTHYDYFFLIGISS